MHIVNNFNFKFVSKKHLSHFRIFVFSLLVLTIFITILTFILLELGPLRKVRMYIGILPVGNPSVSPAAYNLHCLTSCDLYSFN
jgi:hypothetical protein